MEPTTIRNEPELDATLPSPDSRRPYQKPAIILETILETQAGSPLNGIDLDPLNMP